MSQVSIESIEAAIKKIDGLNEDGLDKLIEAFTLTQQDLVNYILQAGLEYENEDLNVFAIYYFAIIMEAFTQEGVALKVIDEDAIEAFQEPFLLALDAIHQDEEYEAMRDLVQQHNLMQFMLAEIESEDEDGEMLSEETQTQLFIVSAGMIGLLHEASK
ncbi:hypothetical protein [Crocinitomix catalasitica]|uniref:hypothetical protein n=1 Tax=Crocinitomix catalasitica TaxID=184607 RepID=UPI000488F64F|nr:hypothetical protein [Crocinitomix catalasitica]